MKQELWVYVNLNEAIADKVDPSSLTFGWDYVSSMQSVRGRIPLLAARGAVTKVWPDWEWPVIM